VRRNALVTGATGFIGRELVSHLDVSEWKVATTSRSPMSGDHVIADLRSREEAKRIIDRVRPQAVFHLAGETRGSLAELFDGNVATTINLLEALTPLEQLPHFVVMGSAAEYGEPETGLVRDTSPTSPQSDYGAIKRLQTNLALSVGQIHGLPVTVVRPFNIVSPDLPATSALGNIRQQLLRQTGDSRTVTCGRVDIFRDYVPVGVIVEALIRLATDSPTARILNVCSGVGIRLGDIVQALAEQLDVQVHVHPRKDLVDLPAPNSIVGDAAPLENLLSKRFRPTPERIAQLLLGHGPEADPALWSEPIEH
jgi:nucleoside-diphosphate-sugar epimerase